MTSEQMTVARASSDLSHKIKKPERNQHATGNQWKDFTDSAVYRHAAPNHQHAQRNCEKNMTRSGHSGNRERLRLFPMLRPRRYHKRQPMRWDGSVQERDGKTANNKRDEDELIHLRNNLTICVRALCQSVYLRLSKRRRRKTETCHGHDVTTERKRVGSELPDYGMI